MSLLSKYITKRDPSEIRDLGINNNDFAPAREPRDSLFSGINLANIVRRATPVQQTPFIGRDFSMFDQAKMGQAPILPGYDEEMDIDDTGRINFADYLKQFGDTAQGGLSDIADKGMSLFDNSKKSGLIRAGLGSMLFGFNPLTAILGAVIGQKGPGIVSAFQQGKFNPMEYMKEKRAERLAQIDREEKARLASRIRGGGDSGDYGPSGYEGMSDAASDQERSEGGRGSRG